MHDQSTFPVRLRRRHGVTALAAVAVLASGYALHSAAFAASGPSAVDYAQCANGSVSSGGDPQYCNRGWINGILQASNSQFFEGQVTPQRLEVAVSAADSHTITLRYQARKGTTHAYDSLAQWDTTVKHASRCDGLNNSQKQGISCSSTTPDSVLAIPVDHTPVAPADPNTTANQDTGKHLPALGNFQMWGGTLTSATSPTHDNAQGAGDDYATITIYYNTTGSTHNVQLMFGGHLAVSNPSRNGWGTGLGASNINGGPYHIKWDAADGASVGSRDNQIMGDAIGDPLQTSVNTTPSPTSATFGAAILNSVSDTATIVGASTPTGTMTFDLYGPFASSAAITATSCVDPSTGVTGNRKTETTASVGLIATSTYGANSGPVNASAYTPGVYQWVAHYSGDFNNAPADGSCGDTTEQLTINTAVPTATSTQTIKDTVTLTGLGTPSGTVDFYLYSENTCSDSTKLVDSDLNVSLSGGSATSKGITPSPAAGGTTYYWKVHYDGDTNNAAGDIEVCQVQTVRVQNAPSTP